MRVRLHTGTHDARGELILLDKEELLPGEECLVQVRLEEPVVSAPGDLFVLRLLSPVQTLGGGVVLEESRHRLKRFKRFVIEELGRQEESLASPAELLASVLARRGAEGATLAELSLELKRPEAELALLVEELRAEGRAASPGQSGRWLAAEALEGEFAELTLALDRWFGARPHRSRMDLRDLRRDLGADKKRLASLLQDAAERGLVEELPGGWVRPKDHEARLEAHLVEAKAHLETKLNAAGFQPVERNLLVAALGITEAELERLLEYAYDRAELAPIGDFVFTRLRLDEAQAAIVANCQATGELVIPALRDTLGTSRKYLIPLLEYFDNAGLTVRSGGNRILKRR